MYIFSFSVTSLLGFYEKIVRHQKYLFYINLSDFFGLGSQIVDEIEFLHLLPHYLKR